MPSLSCRYSTEPLKTSSVAPAGFPRGFLILGRGVARKVGCYRFSNKAGPFGELIRIGRGCSGESQRKKEKQTPARKPGEGEGVFVLSKQQEDCDF